MVPVRGGATATRKGGSKRGVRARTTVAAHLRALELQEMGEGCRG